MHNATRKIYFANGKTPTHNYTVKKFGIHFNLFGIRIHVQTIFCLNVKF